MARNSNPLTNCLVPKCDGVKCKTLFIKETLWDRFYTPQAATTAVLRRTIQNSQESLNQMAFRQNLERHSATKARILSLINFAHPARAEQRDDFVITEQISGFQII